jgi:hypothetical protein
MREFINPFVVKGPPIKSASLGARMRMHDNTPNAYQLTVVNNANGTATLTAPAIVCGGVYRLRLTGLDGKCCYSGLVYTAGCPPVTIPGTYSGDGGVTPPVPSCP